MNSMGIYQHHRRHVPRYVVVWVVVIAAILGGGAALGALTVLAPAADATPPYGHGHDPVTVCHKGRSLTFDDDGYKAHVDHGDTLGACTTPEPTEEPTWTPSPTATPTMQPTSSPVPSASPTPQPSSPEPSVSASATPTPSSEPTPSPTSSPGSSPEPSAMPTSSPTGSPVPSVTSTLSPLPVLPTAETSAVPYTAPAQLAATGMSDGMRAGVGVAVAFLAGGTFLYLVARRRGA